MRGVRMVLLYPCARVVRSESRPGCGHAVGARCACGRAVRAGTLRGRAVRARCAGALSSVRRVATPGGRAEQSARRMGHATSMRPGRDEEHPSLLSAIVGCIVNFHSLGERHVSTIPPFSSLPPS